MNRIPQNEKEKKTEALAARVMKLAGDSIMMQRG